MASQVYLKFRKKPGDRKEAAVNLFRSRPLRFWISATIAIAAGVIVGLLAAVLLTILLWGGRPT